jgi:hypothetical protein
VSARLARRADTVSALQSGVVDLTALSDPHFDPIGSLAERLEVSLAYLRELASTCAECGGRGYTPELWNVFLLTDDARSIARPQAHMRRHRIAREGSRAERLPSGAGFLRVPCDACAGIRHVIEACRAPL